jgi:hypothetical protein
MLVKGLENCAEPCTPSSLESALDGLGGFSVPGDLLFGDFTISPDVHNVLSAIGLFKWDDASGSAVKYGEPVPVGPPGYPAS